MWNGLLLSVSGAVIRADDRYYGQMRKKVYEYTHTHTA